MLYGNTKGIKRATLDALEDLCKIYDKTKLIDSDVLGFLCAVTSKINRELCVFITRNGEIIAVGIGDAATVSLQNFNKKRGENGFSKVRCVHTHPNGSGRLSDLDLSALKNLRLDCMTAVGVDRGSPTDSETAFIDGSSYAAYYCKDADKIDGAALLSKIAEYERASNTAVESQSTQIKPKTAVLVNVAVENGEVELAELESLADTLKIECPAKILQKQSPDKAYCAGSGKLEEIKRAVQLAHAEYVIFNNRLTGSQLNNLEDALGCKVIDRSMLILEIFAAHATTNEGKLQVELAMLKYTLPKIIGQGRALSRIGGGGSGGVATKGAGETKLETDRRKIRRTVFELSKRIETLKKERDLRRERRIKSGIKTVAIVGYTNAGKSTLMNYMSKAGVVEENKLFATLDPVTRRIFVDYKRSYLLTDTVGFIDNLPHEFIDAFKSTLEEAAYADVLLHVADCSSPDLARQEAVVMKVLSSLGAEKTPMITVYNKADLNASFATENPDAVIISSKTGQGVEKLKQMIISKLYNDKADD